jgi:predicted N-acyltransferase
MNIIKTLISPIASLSILFLPVAAFADQAQYNADDRELFKICNRLGFPDYDGASDCQTRFREKSRYERNSVNRQTLDSIYPSPDSRSGNNNDMFQRLFPDTYNRSQQRPKYQQKFQGDSTNSSSENSICSPVFVYSRVDKFSC